jgi:formiminotetrahydrofolate cyclodeaminase
MVAGITAKKLKRDASGETALELTAALKKAEELGATFEALEEADMAAFEAYLKALRLPRSTPAETAERRNACQGAAARATDVPLAMLEAATNVLRLAKKLLEISRIEPLKAESDLGGAVELASAAFRMAELNIRVNLPHLAPENGAQARAKWKDLEGEMTRLAAELREAVLSKLGGDSP